MTEEDSESLEKPKAVKKPRTEAQLAAFEVSKLKRVANSKLKHEQIAVIREKARKMELLSESLAPVIKEEPTVVKEEPIVVKPKKKKQKIVYESDSSSSEEEIIVVKKKKSKSVKDLVVPYTAPVVLQPVIRFI